MARRNPGQTRQINPNSKQQRARPQSTWEDGYKPNGGGGGEGREEEYIPKCGGGGEGREEEEGQDEGYFGLWRLGSKEVPFVLPFAAIRHNPGHSRRMMHTVRVRADNRADHGANTQTEARTKAHPTVFSRRSAVLAFLALWSICACYIAAVCSVGRATDFPTDCMSSAADVLAVLMIYMQHMDVDCLPSSPSVHSTLNAGSGQYTTTSSLSVRLVISLLVLMCVCCIYLRKPKADVKARDLRAPKADGSRRTAYIHSHSQARAAAPRTRGKKPWNGQIFVKWQGKTRTINTTSEDTVGFVLEQLEDLAAERLVFGGEELAQDLEATLLSVGIARNDTLLALGRLRGGGACISKKHVRVENEPAPTEPATPVAEAGTPVAEAPGREVHTVTATAPTATTTTPAGDSADADAVLTTSRSQAHVGHARFLRKKVAADPEAFFGKADADNSDDLSPDEWRATCKLFVADIDDSTVRTLFGEIAGEGATISRPRFFKVAEEYRAARQFVEESKCVDMLVDDLIMMVGDKRSRMTPVQGDQSDQSGADQMSAVLASLDKADGQSLVASLATALCEHAAALKDKLAARVSCEEKQNQADTDNKFSNLPEAAYGEVADFHTGLEVVGILHPRTRDEMHKEHTQKADSQEEFEAWNSGKNVTTPQKEWDFVVEPFDPASVCAGTLPANWEPKHADYGGNRAPIRLQVFLHATSATCASEQGVIAFGNYKHAGGLKDSDELWLHPEEVSMVKVVLLRFVKSQLDGLSLRAAYTRKNIVVGAMAAQPKADKIVKALSTYLGETDGAASKSTFGGVVQALEKDNVASAEELEALMDYFHAKFALEKLTEAEVIAARMYTGPG